ncbi:hypothetical protein PLICRDRAFT_43628 [Plicaturopsis crispa FD-325 SS-3]|nr:hypothetical protein PLICRDRAFT_43628 [Plicaturopsis crispa FD-325 SS-3]
MDLLLNALEDRNAPAVLDAHDLPSIAKYLKSEKCENVFLMLGAGVSTAAGIPDFRSPKTGLYHNLARLDLPYPEAVFEISFFRRNPLPFYTLAQELYPGRFRPTHTHSFIKLLELHGLLHTCFTQNIDTLERRAGVSSHKIVEAHGSFATQRCVDCKLPYDDEKMKKNVKAMTIPRCETCDGLVKPDIVFFGEGLPSIFHKSALNLRDADLLIIIGTSLTVHPFASLPNLVPRECPRLLINMDLVGDIGSRPNDVACLGRCDDVVRDLCRELGWEEELDRAWNLTEHTLEVDPPLNLEHPMESSEANVREEVDQMVRNVERALALQDATTGIKQRRAKGPMACDCGCCLV